MDELSKLTEEDWRRATDRFRLLQPHLEQGRALSEVAREAGVPYRTAWRWANLYRQFGLLALARKGRADVGGRRVLNAELQELVEGLALRKPPMSAASIHREVFRIAQARGETPPSYSVVYDIIRKLPADLVTLAHEGSKAYGDAFELIHRREADRPNAIW